MTFMQHIEALERLHLLIQRKGTGTPEDLARRFNVSVGTIKNLLTILRNKGLPICYCRDSQTYYYEYEVEVRLFWVNTKDNLRTIQGGNNIFNFFSPSQNSCLDPYHRRTKRC